VFTYHVRDECRSALQHHVLVFVGLTTAVERHFTKNAVYVIVFVIVQSYLCNFYPSTHTHTHTHTHYIYNIVNAIYIYRIL
jgi:hypothetical protein